MCRTPIRRITSRRTSPSASSSRCRVRRATSWRRSWRSPSGRSRRSRRGWRAEAPLTDHLRAFLKFLRLNRNASAHTVRAYESDLSQFLVHAAAAAGVPRTDLGPSHLGREAIRAFLADAHRRGQSRATSARKLAAVRTFLRYLRREGRMEGDPGALVATPKREVRMPAHLSEDEAASL